MITKETLEKIEKISIQIDHDISFAGKSKGNKHLYRVVKIASFLAEKLGAHKEIILAGAYLHDVPLSKGNDSDYEKNKEIIFTIVANFSITQQEKEAIAECVASHEGTGGLQTLESKIIHDADVLEKTGLLGIIRHTWKLTNLESINPENITDTEVAGILEHIKWRKNKLQTELAKKIEKYLAIEIPKEKAKNIIVTTSRLAKQGIITEIIAEKILPILDDSEKEKIIEQLDVSYLDLIS